MDYFALLLPLLLIAGLIVGLVFLKRHLFDDDEPHPRIPMPELDERKERILGRTAVGPAALAPAPRHRNAVASPVAGNNDVSLSPARLYPRRLLNPTQMAIFSRLLKALPGYVVLPKITYDHFLEAKDGSPSENTSLQNRASQQLADFIICDRKLRVLLVCQLEDGTQVPARVQEREKMLQKSGLRLLRWNVDQPPDPASLLNTVQTLEKMSAQTSKAVN